jgi:hypothetical protein
VLVTVVMLMLLRDLRCYGIVFMFTTLDFVVVRDEQFSNHL